MARLIKFAGIEIKSPSSCEVSNMDITKKAERNNNGKMLKEKVAKKTKLELSWNYLNKEEMVQIVNIIDTGEFFEVEYEDFTGRRVAMFYVGDRSGGVLDYKNGRVRWKDFKFNIIEQ